MIKETVTYKDFNGTERTEDFYFNLTEAEILDMELGTSGGLSEMIQNVINAKDTPAIMSIFKDLIAKSYGIKSADGRTFKKSEAILSDFISTEAYSQLYMKLATDSEASARFVNGVVPNRIAAQTKDVAQLNPKTN